MGKSITWSTPRFSKNNTAHETDSLFYAEDIFRYLKFSSPYSIKCCFNDALRYGLDRRSVVVPPRSFLIVNEGTEMECLPNRPGVRALIVFFTRALIADVYRNYHLEDKALLDDPYPRVTAVWFSERLYRHSNRLFSQLNALAQQMDATGASNQHNLNPDIFFDLAENLVVLQSDANRRVARLGASNAATREELFSRVMLARELMCDHWNDNLALEDIARRVWLSPFHFHRSFRNVFGVPPMKWFRRYKLEKARELLSCQVATVTDIAFHCGFSDVHAFSKAFKREWGHSPTLGNVNRFSEEL